MEEALDFVMVVEHTMRRTVKTCLLKLLFCVSVITCLQVIFAVIWTRDNQLRRSTYNHVLKEADRKAEQKNQLQFHLAATLSSKNVHGEKSPVHRRKERLKFTTSINAEEVTDLRQQAVPADNLSDSIQNKAHKVKILQVKPDGQQKQVLIFGYTRGGTTFFSELFNRNPNVIFWYEPVDSFYWDYYAVGRWHVPMHVFFNATENNELYLRNYSRWEIHGLLKLHQDLVNCNYEALPSALLWHTHSPVDKMLKLQKFKECAWKLLDNNFDLPASCQMEKRILLFCKNYVSYSLKKGCPEIIGNISRQMETGGRINLQGFHLKKGMQTFFKHFVICRKMAKSRVIQSCSQHLEAACHSSRITAYKALRLNMQTVEYMLRKHPDLFVYYIVRDPRAILNSRIDLLLKTRWSKNDTTNLIEAQLICTKMKSDLDIFNSIKLNYSKNIMQIKYENLVHNFDEKLKDIYDFIGEQIPKEVINWKNKNVTQDGDGHSTERKNWVAGVSRWRQKFVGDPTLKEINKICQPVLQELQYAV